MHLVPFLYFPLFFFPYCSCTLQNQSSLLLLLPRDPAQPFPISLCLMKWCKAMRSFIQHWPLFFSQQVAHTCDLQQLLRIELTFHFASETQGVSRCGNRVYTQGPQPGRRKLNSTSFLSCLLNKLPLNPCTWQWQKAPDHSSSRTNTANSAVISCSLQWREKQIQ